MRTLAKRKKRKKIVGKTQVYRRRHGDMPPGGLTSNLDIIISPSMLYVVRFLRFSIAYGIYLLSSTRYEVD